MNGDEARELARRGELYPGVILHGATDPARRGAALELARTLLCDAAPDERPCGRCRHCRRIPLPEPSEPTDDGAGRSELFHPDLQILERDLKTSTSVEATKAFLKTAQVSPFEARGQVFVITNAETLSGEAANALLKTLEEPHTSAPRHFLLLAPSRLDLLPTLRSRSLSVYLGPAESLPDDEVEPLADDLAGCLAGWLETGSSAWLLAAASAIETAGDWSDPRAQRPWALGARALVLARDRVRDRLPALDGPSADEEGLARLSRGVLAAAEDLLGAPSYRLRSIPAARILDGVLAHRLASSGTAPGGGDRLAGPRRRR
ncbi:MAG: hypothetical protein PVG07_08395 [Acidobacteriota bacterium]